MHDYIKTYRVTMEDGSVYQVMASGPMGAASEARIAQHDATGDKETPVAKVEHVEPRRSAA